MKSKAFAGSTTKDLRSPLDLSITDRRILDDQIQRTIKQFMQVGATVGHARGSGNLRRFIQEGKKIIVSTVQQFPFILNEVELEKGRHFAIVIDEAHSSQGGKTSAAMSKALGGNDTEAGSEDPEDTINAALEARMNARKMLTNASCRRLRESASIWRTGRLAARHSMLTGGSRLVI